jgi:hypothetical protein
MSHPQVPSRANSVVNGPPSAGLPPPPGAQPPPTPGAGVSSQQNLNQIVRAYLIAQRIQVCHNGAISWSDCEWAVHPQFTWPYPLAAWHVLP